jgi:pimeloyl-ACP methyl ester carboxylesterase
MLALTVSIAIGLISWTSGTLGPSDQALSMLRSDDSVQVVQESGMIAFTPAGGQPSSGFILYPGARVDFRSYAPLLRMIASRGYLAVGVRSPLNMPILGPNAADKVIAAYPQISDWVVAGHSLGGVLAASYVGRRADVAGLVLWASYPATSLAGRDTKVLSIYGSNDRLSTPEKVLASKERLPEDAVFFEILGGNHSQFGSYGTQPGDGAATIPPEEQWSQIAEKSSRLLEMAIKDN